MGVTTDVLNRLFSNDIAPVRALRDFGLGLVDRMPPLKSFFIRQASGLAGKRRGFAQARRFRARTIRWPCLSSWVLDVVRFQQAEHCRARNIV